MKASLLIYSLFCVLVPSLILFSIPAKEGFSPDASQREEFPAQRSH
jgi:hypothetical protein